MILALWQLHLVRWTEQKKIIIADPGGAGKTIEDLRKNNFRVQKAKKGAGSVLSGIKKILGYHLIIEPSSKNLAIELNNYVWKDAISELPIDNYNHLIDALRYACNFLMKQKKQKNYTHYSI